MRGPLILRLPIYGYPDGHGSNFELRALNTSTENNLASLISVTSPVDNFDEISIVDTSTNAGFEDVNSTLEKLSSGVDVFEQLEGLNITDEVLGGDNQTTNGTLLPGVSFLFEEVMVPTWVMLLISALMTLMTILCLTVLFTRICHNAKKNKSHKFSDKAPLVSQASRKQSMFPGDDGSASDASDTHSLGKLQYTLDYDMVKQELTVGVIRAMDVPPMDAGGLSDPYVKLVLLPDTKHKHKTKVHEKTLNPVFNEYFKYNVPMVDLKDRVLVFSIYDQDRFSKDDMIGQVKVPFENMDLSSSSDHWADLTEPEPDEEIEIPRGDICFTLQYNPVTGKLTVIIIECKDLMKVDSGQRPNPYIKVDLWRNHKKIQKKKTLKLERTENPYFNESFVFDTMPDQLYLTSIVVSVMHKRSTVGKSGMRIGLVEVGAQVQGSGYRHWNDMIRNPRRSVAGWHTLSSGADL